MRRPLRIPPLECGVPRSDRRQHSDRRLSHANPTLWTFMPILALSYLTTIMSFIWHYMTWIISLGNRVF